MATETATLIGSHLHCTFPPTSFSLISVSFKATYGSICDHLRIKLPLIFIGYCWEDKLNVDWHKIQRFLWHMLYSEAETLGRSENWIFFSLSHLQLCTTTGYIIHIQMKMNDQSKLISCWCSMNMSSVTIFTPHLWVIISYLVRCVIVIMPPSGAACLKSKGWWYKEEGFLPLCCWWPPVYWHWQTGTIIIQQKWRTLFDTCQGNLVGNIRPFFFSLHQIVTDHFCMQSVNVSGKTQPCLDYKNERFLNVWRSTRG